MLQRTERALADATAIGPFTDVGLERRRQELRVIAARVMPRAEQDALLEEIRVWAEACGDPAARGAYAGWMGRLCYRRGQYAEAADLQAEAAGHERWVTAKLSALLLCASSRMEAFQLDEAAAVAGEGREIAQRYRLPFHEARATWILRSVLYRAGRAAAPDVELCDAAAALRLSDTEAMVCLNEGAIAYRTGDVDLACTLTTRAVRAWTALGEVSGGALVASGLAIACGGVATKAEIAALVGRALDSRAPRLGVQTLGLVALSRYAGEAPPFDGARFSALLEAIPDEIWERRLEALSIREAVDAASSAWEALRSRRRRSSSAG
jgi:hypothetical protein